MPKSFSAYQGLHNKKQTAPTEAGPVEKTSLYKAAYLEAERYRAEMVERMGKDFAQNATMEWNRDHWWQWAAQQAIQHVTGERYWIELDTDSFASVTNESPERQRMLEELVNTQQALIQDHLKPFEAKETLRENWAELLNQLLD